MSQEGLARLEEIVRAVVTSPAEVPGSTMTLLAAELRTRPKLLLDALKELSDLGSEPRHGAPDAVESMRGFVNGFCGPRDSETNGPASCRWHEGSSISWRGKGRSR